MVLSILNILLQPLDGHHITVLVLRKAYINLKLLHHLGNGLPLSPNQPAMHTMIDFNILTYLLLLAKYTNTNNNKNNIEKLPGLLHPW